MDAHVFDRLVACLSARKHKQLRAQLIQSTELDEIWPILNLLPDNRNSKLFQALASTLCDLARKEVRIPNNLVKRVLVVEDPDPGFISAACALITSLNMDCFHLCLQEIIEFGARSSGGASTTGVVQVAVRDYLKEQIAGLLTLLEEQKFYQTTVEGPMLNSLPSLLSNSVRHVAKELKPSQGGNISRRLRTLFGRLTDRNNRSGFKPSTQSVEGPEARRPSGIWSSCEDVFMSSNMSNDLGGISEDRESSSRQEVEDHSDSIKLLFEDNVDEIPAAPTPLNSYHSTPEPVKFHIPCGIMSEPACLSPSENSRRLFTPPSELGERLMQSDSRNNSTVKYLTPHQINCSKSTQPRNIMSGKEQDAASWKASISSAFKRKERLREKTFPEERCVKISTRFTVLNKDITRLCEMIQADSRTYEIQKLAFRIVSGLLSADDFIYLVSHTWHGQLANQNDIDDLWHSLGKTLMSSLFASNHTVILSLNLECLSRYFLVPLDCYKSAAFRINFMSEAICYVLRGSNLSKQVVSDLFKTLRNCIFRDGITFAALYVETDLSFSQPNYFQKLFSDLYNIMFTMKLPSHAYGASRAVLHHDVREGRPQTTCKLDAYDYPLIVDEIISFFSFASSFFLAEKASNTTDPILTEWTYALNGASWIHPSRMSSLKSLASIVEFKLHISERVNEFKYEPKDTIEQLISSEYLDSSASAIVEFLICFKVDKDALGTWFGEAYPVAQNSLKQYVKMLDFENSHPDEALQSFLKLFRIPGEGQKIDRIIEAFANEYVMQNPNFIDAPAHMLMDLSYILAFSCIMLHTDAHNNDVAQKMTREAFIRNCQSCDNGSYIPESLLSDIYLRTVSSKWEVDNSLIFDYNRPALIKLPRLRPRPANDVLMTNLVPVMECFNSVWYQDFYHSLLCYIYFNKCMVGKDMKTNVKDLLTHSDFATTGEGKVNSVKLRSQEDEHQGHLIELNQTQAAGIPHTSDNTSRCKADQSSSIGIDNSGDLCEISGNVWADDVSPGLSCSPEERPQYELLMDEMYHYTVAFNALNGNKVVAKGIQVFAIMTGLLINKPIHGVTSANFCSLMKFIDLAKLYSDKISNHHLLFVIAVEIDRLRQMWTKRSSIKQLLSSAHYKKLNSLLYTTFAFGSDFRVQQICSKCNTRIRLSLPAEVLSTAFLQQTEAPSAIDNDDGIYSMGNGANESNGKSSAKPTPDNASILKQWDAVYKHINTYQHVAELEFNIGEFLKTIKPVEAFGDALTQLCDVTVMELHYMQCANVQSKTTFDNSLVPQSASDVNDHAIISNPYSAAAFEIPWHDNLLSSDLDSLIQRHEFIQFESVSRPADLFIAWVVDKSLTSEENSFLTQILYYFYYQAFETFQLVDYVVVKICEKLNAVASTLQRHSLSYSHIIKCLGHAYSNCSELCRDVIVKDINLLVASSRPGVCVSNEMELITELLSTELPTRETIAQYDLKPTAACTHNRIRIAFATLKTISKHHEVGFSWLCSATRKFVLCSLPVYICKADSLRQVPLTDPQDNLTASGHENIEIYQQALELFEGELVKIIDKFCESRACGRPHDLLNHYVEQYIENLVLLLYYPAVSVSIKNKCINLIISIAARYQSSYSQSEWHKIFKLLSSIFSRLTVCLAEILRKQSPDLELVPCDARQIFLNIRLPFDPIPPHLTGVPEGFYLLNSNSGELASVQTQLCGLEAQYMQLAKTLHTKIRKLYFDAINLHDFPEEMFTVIMYSAVYLYIQQHERLGTLGAALFDSILIENQEKLTPPQWSLICHLITRIWSCTFPSALLQNEIPDSKAMASIVSNCIIQSLISRTTLELVQRNFHYLELQDLFSLDVMAMKTAVFTGKFNSQHKKRENWQKNGLMTDMHRLPGLQKLERQCFHISTLINVRSLLKLFKPELCTIPSSYTRNPHPSICMASLSEYNDHPFFIMGNTLFDMLWILTDRYFGTHKLLRSEEPLLRYESGRDIAGFSQLFGTVVLPLLLKLPKTIFQIFRVPMFELSSQWIMLDKIILREYVRSLFSTKLA